MFDTRIGPRRGDEPERVVTPLVRAAQIDDELRELAALVAATEAKILDLVAEREALDLDLLGWKSTAQWLSATAGYSPSIARSQVEVASKLNSLPEIKEAFSSGEVSFGEIKEIVPIATPESQEVLLSIARHAPVSTTQRFARAYGRARLESQGETEEKLRRRSVRSWFTDDGMYRLNALLMKDEGAIVERALDSALEGLKAERTEGITDTNCTSDHQVTRADALVAMAETLLEHGLPTGSPGGPVVMHVDIETLAGRDGEVANLDRKIGIPKETVDRYMCDASIKAVLERDGDPLHVGRKYRGINSSMRTALEVRDECCQWPGCIRTRRLDAHHLWEWGIGGLTNIEDLRLYCRSHHVLLHEGGYRAVLNPDGSLTHLRPDGRPVYEPRGALPPEPSATVRDIEVDEKARPHLTGEKLNHVYAASLAADDDDGWGPPNRQLTEARAP
ncbi:MAG: DUF222 domain-containing protein [Actinomycetota bacterium]